MDRSHLLANESVGHGAYDKNRMKMVSVSSNHTSFQFGCRQIRTSESCKSVDVVVSMCTVGGQLIVLCHTLDAHINS